MTTITVNDSLEKLLHELSFQDSREVIKEPLATEILARIAAFKSEVKHFEKKYGKSFQEVKAKYEKEEEQFEVYDDLMAWEFAVEGLNYWQQKLDDIHRVL